MMAEELARVRHTSIPQDSYCITELREMVKHREIWPVGCDIIEKVIRKYTPTNTSAEFPHAFKAHYSALYAAVMNLQYMRTHFTTIPKDCVNEILDNMISVDQLDADFYSTAIMGHLYSRSDLPSCIWWKTPCEFTLEWHYRGKCVRHRGPRCIVVRNNRLRFKFSYNPHDRDELRNYKVHVQPRRKYQHIEYIITCGMDDFIAICGQDMPQNLDEAEQFRAYAP